MKMKLEGRDRASNWHGAPKFTLKFYGEWMDSTTRDRVWEAIEKALPTPETKSEKSSAIGFDTSHE